MCRIQSRGKKSNFYPYRLNKQSLSHWPLDTLDIFKIFSEMAHHFYKIWKRWGIIEYLLRNRWVYTVLTKFDLQLMLPVHNNDIYTQNKRNWCNEGVKNILWKGEDKLCIKSKYWATSFYNKNQNWAIYHSISVISYYALTTQICAHTLMAITRSIFNIFKCNQFQKKELSNSYKLKIW